MSKEKAGDIKKVQCEVSEEILIDLKILSLRKKVKLQEYVAEVLAKHVQSKSKQLEVIGE
jgi:hypothetical protein